MLLRRLDLKGLTTFARPISIDFEALGPGLVALAGLNGSGKTSAMEAVAACLYKAFPTRPGWYEWFHGRDAYIETLWSDADGREVKVRVQVDTDQRKTESYLFVDGASVTTGRAKEFEAEIEKRFGSWALLLSSTFAAQDKAGSFVGMPKSQRKGLFVELLGLSRLEVLHEEAKGRHGRADADLSVQRARVEGVERELAGLPGLEAAREDAQRAADAAAHRLETARTEEAAAQGALSRAREAAASLASLEQIVGGARRQVESQRQALAGAQNLGAQARKAAEARLTAARAADPDGRDARARKGHRETLAGIERKRTALGQRRAALEQTLKNAPDVDGARGKLAAAEREQADLQAAQQQADTLNGNARLAMQKAEAAKDKHAAAVDQRKREVEALERRTDLLPKVPCTADGVPPALASTCPLLADARQAQQALNAIGESDEDPLWTVAEDARKASEAAAEVVAKAALAARSCNAERLAELAGDIRAHRDAVAHAGAVAAAREQIQQLLQDGHALDHEAHAANNALNEELAEVSKLRERIAAEEIAIDQELTDALMDAEDKVLVAQKDLAIVQKELAVAEQRLDAARRDTQDIAAAQDSLARAAGERAAAEKAVREMDQKLAGLVAQVDALKAKEPEAEEARLAVRAAEQEVGDWNLVEKALGRDGIQALEIDAAGPEVARLANELLEACYGPRFSLSFETLRERKGAPGEYSEAFDIRTYDNGRERPIEGLSGGERVIVGEALSLAIAIFNARKNSIRHRQLFRDETAGALDHVAAIAYVDMLRRARELGGFHQVVFIAHQRELVDRADVRLMVEGGQVSIDGGTKSAAPERAA